jgi:asparagine synthase (glutamine-hydrolysing)
MCGIAGFYSPSVDDSEKTVNDMLDVMHYRGPDDRNTVEVDNLHLGHLRLSIIDMDHGQQPMVSSEGRYTLIYNGEVYNYLELRQRLVSKGHTMKSFSDTEVLLHMYMEYGKEMLNQLNGMFAFAIYDRHSRELFLARDHFGIKPLYYTDGPTHFVFASEIKAILKHPLAPVESNQNAIHEYLRFQMVLGQETLFKGVQKLEPAHYMVVKNGKIIDKKEYWSLEYAIDDRKSEGQYTDELLVLLEHSLAIQTRSDVPVGAYLSGGLDSSIVAKLASKNYMEGLQTFTGKFNLGDAYDESYYATLMSRHIGSEHNEITPTPQDFLDNFESLVYYMDEPAAGPGLFAQCMVSKMAAKHVKVVLSGQGADEVFGGYARYVVAYLEQCLKGSIFESQEEGNHVVTLSSIIPNLSLLKQYLPLMRTQFAGGLFDDMDKRYFRLIDRSPNLGDLYRNEFLEEKDASYSLDRFSDVFNQPDTSSYFNKMTHFDMKALLPALLQVEDRVSMSVSIESRVPLLDRRIVELAAKVPPTMKFAGGKTKHILNKAVENILPAEIVRRRDKMGFPTPFNLWTKGPLKEYTLDTLMSQQARSRGLLKTDSIEELIGSQQDYGRQLWGALNLEIWHRRFIDN